MPFRIAKALGEVAACFFAMKTLLYVAIGCLGLALGACSYLLVAGGFCYLVGRLSRLESRLTTVQATKMHENA
jgi:hypothetical protein